MKVPARKQGNGACDVVVGFHIATSMKVPTRKRGNLAETDKASKGHYPHLHYQSAIELVIPPQPRVASK